MSILTGLADANGRIPLKASGNAKAYDFRGLAFTTATDDDIIFSAENPIANPFYLGGLKCDSIGRIAVVAANAVALPLTYLGGLPFDANGKLVVSLNPNLVPVRYDQGVGFAADGGVQWAS